MAPKRSGVSRNQAHSRSSSSTRLSALAGLQFTQKEASPSKLQDRPKKNGHVVESQPRQPKLVRNPSRDYIPPAPGPSKRPSGVHGGRAAKVEFSLSTSVDDDSEWVSSESGAATPLGEADDDDRVGPRGTDIGALSAALHNNGDAGALAGTPRAERPPQLPRVETARKIAIQQVDSGPTFVAAPTPPLTSAASVPPSRPSMNRTRTDPLKERSRTPPADRQSPDANGDDRRFSIARPASTRSVKNRLELRPHPLIRGHSFGPNKPSVAPLTISSDSAQAEISSNSPSLSTSPTSVYHVSSTRSPLNPAASSSSHQLRRSSISSAKSVATLPSQSVAPFRGTHDRHRTISTMSATSSSAALSSLAHLPMTSRPATPPYSTHFPPQSYPAHMESIHPLLPQPYLQPHLTVLAHRNPLRESYDRVMRAKHIR